MQLRWSWLSQKLKLRWGNFYAVSLESSNDSNRAVVNIDSFLWKWGLLLETILPAMISHPISVENGRELDKELPKSSWEATGNLADAAGTPWRVSGLWIMPVAFNEPTHWLGWWWRTRSKTFRYTRTCSAWPSSHHWPWQETVISTSLVPELSGKHTHNVFSGIPENIGHYLYADLLCCLKDFTKH